MPDTALEPRTAAPTQNRLHNVWLIASREYLERIRTRSFLLATVLIPVLLGGFLFVSGFLGQRAKSNAHVAIVSADARFAEDLKHQLETGKHSQMTVDLAQPSPAIRSTLEADLKAKNGITGYLWVTPGPTGNARPNFAYVARSAGDLTTVQVLSSSIQTVLTREGLTSKGVGSGEIDTLLSPVDIDTSSTGNSKLAFYASFMLFLLMYMVIMLYGMNTARSIIEEKTSRVFEVMLSTITADEMLAGKILGVGAVGLTQIGIWMIVAGVLATTNIAASFLGGGPIPLTIPQLIFFVVYFLFGYLIYSSIAAALGAMTNSEQELQQLNMFLVLPLSFCFLMTFVIQTAPNSTLAKVVSLIPFCSPLLMTLRISLTTVAPWEIALSFVLMSITIVAILWVASRIYRVGILMYGKKPNLPEILLWLKYS